MIQELKTYNWLTKHNRTFICCCLLKLDGLLCVGRESDVPVACLLRNLLKNSPV